MKFNVNDHVWVKLTDRGQSKISRRQNVPEPLEKNGYTRFQLWELMSLFGDSMFCGSELNFETKILIGEDP